MDIETKSKRRDVPKSERIRLLHRLSARFGWICWYCQEPLHAPEVHVPPELGAQIHLDHIVPRSAERENDFDALSNLCIACGFCNMARRTMDAQLFCAWLDRVRMRSGWHPILHGVRR
jgi:5-methylcytosine-specific restriction endonuclease McrA